MRLALVACRLATVAVNLRLKVHHAHREPHPFFPRAYLHRTQVSQSVSSRKPTLTTKREADRFERCAERQRLGCRWGVSCRMR